MLQLFRIPYKTKSIAANPLSLDTPIGEVKLEVFVGEGPLSEFPPTISGEISENSQLQIWDFEQFHIELLKANIVPDLPPGMEVDRCVFFLWKFKNRTKEELLTQFNCRIVFNQTTDEGEPETGEGLIAQSWYQKNQKITIASEDEEYMLARAKENRGFPPRFEKFNLISSESFEFLKDGIQISLPPLLENEEGQIQFVISWAKGNEERLVSTWFAVDITSEEVLKTLV